MFVRIVFIQLPVESRATGAFESAPTVRKEKYFPLRCELLPYIRGSREMKRRQFLTTTTATASTIAVAGCGGGGSSEPQGEVTAEVTLTEDEAYDPLRVQVAEGEAVRWINETGEQRTVRANTEVDDSKEWELDLAIEADDSGVHTFQNAGIYSYHDAQDTHFLMCGAVAVGDTSEDDIESLPCE